MIRSSHIPTLLNKACDHGIQRCLLITSDGDLLGSSSSSSTSNTNTNATPINPFHDGTNHTTPTTPSTNLPPPPSWEQVDPQTIAALLSETMMEYRQMGAEVASALSSVSSSNGGNGSSRNASARAMSYDSGDKLVDRSSLSLGGGGGGRRGVGLLQCILLEMEQGRICISMVNTSVYVVALAGPSTQEGMLKAKMTALAALVKDQVKDAFEVTDNYSASY